MIARQCVLVFGAVASAAIFALPALGASCDSLASLKLPDTTVTMAETVAAGAFMPPAGTGRGPGGGGNRADLYKELPAFCRVALTLKPTSDSDIKVEVWLPESGWNHKFQAVGNPLWAGSILYPNLAQALRNGYAAVSTDTGHVGANGKFAFGHPEKVADFGWRSEHEMTVKGKQVVNAFYGEAPKLSYWIGCSSGGKQGLKEAQRFPDDYDGIVAGAPVLNWTHRAVAVAWVGHVALIDPAGHIPPEKYEMIHKAAIVACDEKDGLKDGLIGDPEHCDFDPQVLLCKGADGPGCLTAAQVKSVRGIYTPATNPRTGEKLSARYEPGSEPGWRNIAGGPDPFSPVLDHFRYIVFKDPNWDWRTFNFDSDVALTDKIDDGTINATDPNLSAFVGHGGKLIMYQGWTDTNIAPGGVITYYDAVQKTLGEAKTDGSIRLFMAPGMNHCGGGDGPNVFDMTAALEQWVENSKAPSQVLAEHRTAGKVDRTRPLCPYPQVAKYNGSGSIDDAANFSCKLP